jgi:hypothetical protein
MESSIRQSRTLPAWGRIAEVAGPPRWLVPNYVGEAVEPLRRYLGFSFGQFNSVSRAVAEQSIAITHVMLYWCVGGCWCEVKAAMTTASASVLLKHAHEDQHRG